MTGLEALNETVNKFADVILLGGHEERNATNLTNAVNYLERTPQIRALRKCVRALEIIKKTKNIKLSFYENGSGKHYKIEFDKTRNQTITEEEFNLLKEVLE